MIGGPYSKVSGLIPGPSNCEGLCDTESKRSKSAAIFKPVHAHGTHLASATNRSQMASGWVRSRVLIASKVA